MVAIVRGWAFQCCRAIHWRWMRRWDNWRFSTSPDSRSVRGLSRRKTTLGSGAHLSRLSQAGTQTRERRTGAEARRHLHILWINLVTDGLPGLALSAEREERGIRQRPPRPPTESIFAHGMWQHILWVGLLMGAASIITQAWALHTGHGHWQTMVFTVLTLSQLGHVLAIRSERDSLFTQGVWSNRPLTAALLFTFALHLATIYVPWLNPIFKTAPLTLDELAFCLAMSMIVFAGVEIEKWMIRRGWIYRAQAPSRTAP